MQTKQIYLDIMEKSLSAYTPQRIADYVEEVRTKGLTEHGFPRLAANIGILIAHGRCADRLPLFTEMMDLCCQQMPVKNAANDFSVREVCCCLMALEGKNILPEEKLAGWKSQLSAFVARTRYDCVAKTPDKPIGNWAAFSSVSEVIRGEWCGQEYHDFCDMQLATVLLSLDENGMYRDPHNPMLYDVMTRVLLLAHSRFGYHGKWEPVIRQRLAAADTVSLQMQSVTGELPFGGRSNQFLFNEPVLASLYEAMAGQYAANGRPELAGACRAAALLAAENCLRELSRTPIHHVKNRYPVATTIGCEGYAYFNKYMITTASNAYLAYLFADESIVPTTAPTLQGGYVAKTGEEFHKVFLNAGGYFLEWDTNADFAYDACGLGRVQKKDCPGTLCLSVPFPGTPANYKPEHNNPFPMTMGFRTAAGDTPRLPQTLQSFSADENKASAEFVCTMPDGTLLTQTVCADAQGVTLSATGENAPHLLLPVFEFDGEEETAVCVEKGTITVTYRQASVTYTFDAPGPVDSAPFYNRSGRYRVYEIPVASVHITMNAGA